jgi:CheY-specific phosphatase CheX
MIDLDSIFESFIETAQHVILSMAPVELKRGEVMSSDKNPFSADVSGNLGITGEMRLSLTVSFSKEAISAIYGHVFPEESRSGTIFHMGDLVGEITNMIGGSFRNMASELGMQFDSSIPSIVIGAQQVFHPAGSISRVIPFHVDGHPMFIEVSIRSN